MICSALRGQGNRALCKMNDCWKARARGAQEATKSTQEAPQEAFKNAGGTPRGIQRHPRGI